MVCLHNHMWIYLWIQCESEEADYFTHNYVCFSFVQEEKKNQSKPTENSFPKSLTSYDPGLKEGRKEEVYKVFQKILVLLFSGKSMIFLKYFEKYSSSSNIFSALHYSSDNTKDWAALSSWLKFSARLLDDCSSLMIYQCVMYSMQHAFILLLTEAC